MYIFAYTLLILTVRFDLALTWIPIITLNKLSSSLAFSGCHRRFT